MDRTHWHRVKSLFEAARDSSKQERSAILDALPQPLRREVEALLAADRTTGPLDTPTHIAELAAGVLAGPHPDEHIGPYRLLREIGRGGMGTVYQAERDDGSYRQTVALKIIHAGLDTEVLHSRFLYERQILAELDHPNIARLHDGGKTPDGRPYLVMEYVAGRPITEFCDLRSASIEQRLGLFATACRAVQHAHRNLIVHRDLKPSNIAVTEDGKVKLLDFGIAKLLDERAMDTTVPKTQTGLRLMTLEYAAPEQIKGEAITTATDVYQLGVLLYELITGTRPFRSGDRPRREVERSILEDEPTRPSVAIQETKNRPRVDGATGSALSSARDRNRLRRRLSGDLDNIVLTALKKEPERRYASIDLMLEDLRRHAVGLPVAARPDTFAYRTSKFVVRHRVEVASLITGIVIITSLVFYYTSKLTQERNRARAEATKGAAISEFLQEMLASADPNRTGRTVTVAEVLDAAGHRLEEGLVDQPEIKASLHATLGVTYKNLGLLEHAEPHARAALALRRENASTLPHDLLESQIALGRLLYEKGSYDEAESLLRDSLDRLRNLRPVDSLRVAEALDALGVVLNEQNRDEEAEECYRQALRLYRRNGAGPAAVGRVLNNLGIVLGNRGVFAEAERLHREAVSVMRLAHSGEHPEVLYAMNNLAGVLDAQGHYAEAESLYRHVLDSRRRLLGNEHPWTVLTMTSLANLLWLREEFSDAVYVAREAVGLGEKGLPKGHPLTAYAHLVLGQSLTDDGQAEDGEPHLRAALTMREEALPRDHWLIANTQSVLGGCLVAQRRFEEAEPLLLTSFQRLQSDRGPEHEKTRDAAQRLVDLYAQWGRPLDADRYRLAGPAEN